MSALCLLRPSQILTLSKFLSGIIIALLNYLSAQLELAESLFDLGVLLAYSNDGED